MPKVNLLFHLHFAVYCGTFSNGDEKETLGAGHSVYVGGEASSIARIFIVPEELHRRSSQLLPEADRAAVFPELIY